jgi:predicted dehydrogenase
MKKIRWGVLSTAHIGRTKVIPALQSSNHNQLIAISSRQLETARKTAHELGITRAYASYEELLEDPEINAIYNPLPNHLHVDWSIKALEAGKHVLCEKPLGLDAKDAKRLLEATNAHTELKVMEAFMYRFHPQWSQVKNLVRQGRIGKLRHVHSHFSYNNRDSNNIRNLKSMGGGALLDVGCYCISSARWLFEAEPIRVFGQFFPFEGQEVDCLVTAMMEFEQGLTSFTVSTKIEPYQMLEASGEAGGIYLSMPFTPTADAITQIQLKQSSTHTSITVPAANQYTLMVDSFALSIIHNQPVTTPLTDAIANMKIIDAIFQSTKSGNWVSV